MNIKCTWRGSFWYFTISKDLRIGQPTLQSFNIEVRSLWKFRPIGWVVYRFLEWHSKHSAQVPSILAFVTLQKRHYTFIKYFLPSHRFVLGRFINYWSILRNVSSKIKIIFMKIRSQPITFFDASVPCLLLFSKLHIWPDLPLHI